jgi:hypothetical protein
LGLGLGGNIPRHRVLPYDYTPFFLAAKLGRVFNRRTIAPLFRAKPFLAATTATRCQLPPRAATRRHFSRKEILTSLQPRHLDGGGSGRPYGVWQGL